MCVCVCFHFWGVWCDSWPWSNLQPFGFIFELFPGFGDTRHRCIYLWSGIQGITSHIFLEEVEVRWWIFGCWMDVVLTDFCWTKKNMLSWFWDSKMCKCLSRQNHKRLPTEKKTCLQVLCWGNKLRKHPSANLLRASSGTASSSPASKIRSLRLSRTLKNATYRPASSAPALLKLVQTQGPCELSASL